MAIRSNSDRRYYRRFLIIGTLALGWAVYCLYDGFIGYPNQRERALAYLRLEEEYRGRDPAELLDAWHKYAQERDWPTTHPGEPKSQGDIYMQFVMAAVTGAIGLWLLSGVWRTRGDWIEQTDSGLTSSWGQTLDYDQVLAIDKRKWRNKGIAKIRYQEGNRKRRFVLDNFKFQRDSTDRILYDLESHVGHDKIINGPPEPLYEEHEEIIGNEPDADVGGSPERTEMERT
jgi:hypothetical protein